MSLLSRVGTWLGIPPAKKVRSRKSRAVVTYPGHLKHVAQLDAVGCGIACVAMVANVDYKVAKKNVKSRPNRSGNSTYYADLRWALDRLGISYATNGRMAFRFRGWGHVSDRAIVAVETVPGRKHGWHWVVFDRVNGVGYVLDPAEARGYLLASRSRLVGKSYMRIDSTGP